MSQRAASARHADAAGLASVAGPAGPTLPASSAKPAGRRAIALVFAAATLLSATLLFFVQPMIAKSLLPRFGGSAAVWTTCLLFFQLLLLAGYAYGDLLVRFVPLVRQPLVHLGVLLLGAGVAAAGGLDAAAAETTLRAVGATALHPIVELLGLLALTIGVPYFVLSTTGPLLQAWWVGVSPGSRGTYRLYAVSNAGSVAALIAYPTLVEPTLDTGLQASGWIVAFVAFAALAAGAAWSTRRALAVPASVAPSARAVATAPEAIGTGRALHWLALSATGSLLLMSITAHLTQNVAPVPFLWTLPLALYLISFILCFEADGWYRRRMYQWLALALLAPMGLGLHLRLDVDHGLVAGVMPLWQALPLYAGGLFVACMVCHGELAARRPVDRPTRFYLMVALGGAVGGAIAALAGPLLFPGPWELPIALLALAMLLWPGIGTWGRRTLALTLPAALVVIVGTDQSVGAKTLERSRNFYGSVRVTDVAESDGRTWRRLEHGTILHGGQVVGADGPPSTYYTPRSGLGASIAALREARGRPLSIGVIGLGVGSIAAYGRDGDRIRFYELDPQIRPIADRHFTFLARSAASIEHRLGDGRLVMRDEPAQRYDTIVVDAFSGDAIPVHLLTREAMAIYRRHLAPDGVVLFHVSNHFLDLLPVVAGLAESDGASMRVVATTADPRVPHETSSVWTIVTRDADLLHRAPIAPVATPYVGRAPLEWTDARSSLLQVMR